MVLFKARKNSHNAKKRLNILYESLIRPKSQNFVTFLLNCNCFFDIKSQYLSIRKMMFENDEG